ncbi:MAG: cytidylyltransferase domain-containing protein [Spirochaetota bacterium]
MPIESNTLTPSPFSVVAIIQARMNSSRLPQKSTKLLAGKPILAHIIERAFSMKHVEHVIVATGNEHDNQPILSLAREMGAVPFSGSDEDVLQRFTNAARIFNSDFIIRITGDNPFTDTEYGTMAIEHAFETKADLSSVINIPLGTAIELVKTTALYRAFDEATQRHQHEHVTPYIKENPDLFTIIRKPVTIYNMIPDLRLTIDTPEDFEFASHIYNALYRGKPFSLHHVLNFLRINRQLLTINRNIRQRPMTHVDTGMHELYPSHNM